MPIELLQHFYSSSRDGRGTVATSAGLSQEDIRRIEAFCSYDLTLKGEETPNLGPWYTYFRIEPASFGLCRVQASGLEVSGNAGHYLAHTLVGDLKTFRQLESNCFKLISQGGLFSDVCSEPRSDLPSLQATTEMADDFNWLEPLTSVPSEGILVALINAGVTAGKDERPVVLVPPDPDAGLKILRALLLCMPVPLRESISLSTYRRNHYDAEVRWMATGDDPGSLVSEVEARYHTYYFNFLDNKFSQVDDSCTWGHVLAPLILERDFQRVGELVSSARGFDLKDAVATLNRIATRTRGAATPVRRQEEGPAGPDLGQLVDALGKTEPGRKMLTDRFQQYLAGALKTNQPATILALARAISRCIPKVEDAGLQTHFSRLVAVTVESLILGRHLDPAGALLDDVAALGDLPRAEIQSILGTRGTPAVRQAVRALVQGPLDGDILSRWIDLVRSTVKALPSSDLATEWLAILVESCSREGWIGSGWKSLRTPLEESLHLLAPGGQRRIMEAIGMGLIAGGLLDEYPEWLIVHWLPAAVESGTGVVAGLQEIGFFNYVVATASQDTFLALLDGLRKHPEEIPDFFRVVFSVAEADPTGRLRQICLDSLEEDPSRMERDYGLLLEVLSQAGEYSEYKKVFLVNWLPWNVAAPDLVKKLQLVAYRDVVMRVRDPGLVTSIHRELRQRADAMIDFQTLLYEISLDDPGFERWVTGVVPELSDAFVQLRPTAQDRRERVGRQGTRGVVKGVIEKLRDAWEKDPDGFPASLLMAYNDFLSADLPTLIEQQSFLFSSIDQFTHEAHPNGATLLRLHAEIVRRGLGEELTLLLPEIASRVVVRRGFMERPPDEQNEYLEFCLRSFPDDPLYQRWLDLCSELYDLDQMLSATPPVPPPLESFGCFLNYQDDVPRKLLEHYVDRALGLFAGRKALKVSALVELAGVFDIEAWPGLLERFMKIYVEGINWTSIDLSALADVVSKSLSETSHRRISFLNTARIFLVRMQAGAIRDLQNLMAQSWEVSPQAAETWNEVVEEELKRRKSQGVLGMFRRKAGASA